MAEVNKKVIDEIKRGNTIFQVLDNEGAPTGIFKGPWLEKFYDNYTEALRENQTERRVKLLKEKGLNEFGQTADQEKSFKKRQALSKEKQERAEALNDAIKVNQ